MIKIKVDEANKKAIITADLETRPSNSGKNILIACSGGPLVTEGTYNGKPITVNLSAWVKP